MVFHSLFRRPGLAAAAGLLALGSVPAVATPPASSAPPSVMTLPDGSLLPLPPGARAFGPRGAVAPPAAPAENRSAAPGRDTPPPSPAERRRQTLDELYDRLAAARDAQEASAISARISNVQELSGSDTANLLMQRVVASISAKDNATALALLDKLVTLQPRWAEAWNKRATVRYLNDDDVGSMEDISHVLALQPRHFGALSGMGMILHRNGDDRGAMTALKRAEAINPQDESVKSLIEQLKPAVEGTEL